MTSPRNAGPSASGVAKFLRESVKVDGSPPSSESRGAAIVAIERAIVTRSRRKRARVGLGIAALAAAAATVLAMFKVFPSDGDAGKGTASSTPILAHAYANGATVIASNESDLLKAVPLRDGALVSHGQRVFTPAGGKVVFAHPGGTELTLNGGSDMSVVEDDQNRIYSLGKGTLDLRVAKLKTNERLMVRTVDAEVEVRGTRFHVEVTDSTCDGHVTRVSVDEGVVVVRRDGAEARLTAGQSWPPCTQAQASTSANGANAPQVKNDEPQTAPSTPAPSTLAPSTLAPSAVPGPAVLEVASSAGSSTIEQNDLFDDGIEKKRRGDMAGAAAAFERLLTKYPHGPLAESAAAQRVKVLRTSNPARAKVAAREYLYQWPRGFARDDAESVLREAP